MQTLVLHLEGNLLINLIGNHIIDRLLVVISSDDIEKLLAIRNLQKGNTKEQVFAIYQILKDWS